LQEELAQLDLDRVTYTFGYNFGEQPSSLETKPVSEVAKELEGVVDLNQIGGVFEAAKTDDSIRLPTDFLQQEDVDERIQIDGEEPPFETDDEDDEEYMRLMADFSAVDPLKDLTEDEIERKSELLLTLINSRDCLEETIQDNLDEIDDALLRILDGRIAQAEDDQESDSVIHGLQYLFNRLAAEIDRREAPDEMRLLDACLDIMIPEGVYEEADPESVEQRRGEVLDLLQEAFALPGADGSNVDIFGLASAIGPQQRLDVEELEARNIFGYSATRESFVDSVRKMIAEVEERQREEFLLLKKWSDEAEQPDVEPEEKALYDKQIEEMRRKLKGQRHVLAVTKEILGLAESITW